MRRAGAGRAVPACTKTWRLPGDHRAGATLRKHRLEAASTRALSLGSCRYHTVKNILSASQDRLPLESPAETNPTPTHDNIRGADYYAAAIITEEDRC